MMITDDAVWIETPLTLTVLGMAFPAMLTLPRDAEVRGAVVLVPGSLFCDVNGDFPAWNVRPHIYAHLAHQLAARGWASYRYAKPGPGTGTVTVDAEAARAHHRFVTRAEVAREALAQMRAALAEAGVRAPRTLLAGHSEGAVVVSLLAPDAEDVDGVVLLSGPSVGLLMIMREQIAEMDTPGATPEQAVANFDRAADHIRRGELIPDDVLALPGVNFGMMNNPAAIGYLRDVELADPALAAARIPQPVLLVQGTRDLSVRAHHAARLAAAREGLPTETVLVEGVTHFYKPMPEDMDPMAWFGLEGEPDPAVADAMDRWGMERA